MNQFLVQILGKKSWGKNQILALFSFPHHLLGEELVGTFEGKTNLGSSQVISNFLDIMAAKYKVTGLVVQFRILMSEQTSMMSRESVQSVYRQIWDSHKEYLKEDITLRIAIRHIIVHQGTTLLDNNSNNQVGENFTVALLNTLLAKELKS